MGSVTEEELLLMVRGFNESSESASHSVSSPKSLRQSKYLTLQEILWNATDHENEVLAKISIYLRDMGSIYMIDQPKSLKNKWVVLKLKMDGYEASLCKTSWVSPIKLPRFHEFTEDYEYVDVMMKDKNLIKVIRLIEDMDFKSQFEVARPTPSYIQLKDILPDIFVGSEDKLEKVVSLVCTAAKKSLKKRRLMFLHGEKPPICNQSGSPKIARKSQSHSPTWNWVFSPNEAVFISCRVEGNMVKNEKW